MPGAAIVHRGWLARDPGRLVALLADCAGNPAYDTMQLRQDLDRSSSCSAATTAGNCSARHRHNANGMASPLEGQPSPKLPHQQELTGPLRERRSALCGQ